MICRRCGNPFDPVKAAKALGFGRQTSRFCAPCGLRNLFDGLNMVTPPDLIDVHTKQPTLTNTEFWDKLKSKPRKK